MKIDQELKAEDFKELEKGDCLKVGSRAYPFLSLDGEELEMHKISSKETTVISRNLTKWLYDNTIRYIGKLTDNADQLVGHIIKTIDTVRIVRGPYFVKSVDGDALHCETEDGTPQDLRVKNFFNDVGKRIVDQGYGELPAHVTQGSWWWIPQYGSPGYVLKVNPLMSTFMDLRLGTSKSLPISEYTETMKEGDKDVRRMIPLPGGMPAQLMAKYVTLKMSHANGNKLTTDEASWLTQTEDVFSGYNSVTRRSEGIESLDDRHKSAIIDQLMGHPRIGALVR